MAKINPGEFVRQVRQETAKVTWASRKQTTITTILVFVVVALAAIFFFLVDTIIGFGLSALLGIGG